MIDKPLRDRGVESGTGKMHFVDDDGRLACHRQLVNGKPRRIYGLWDWCQTCYDVYSHKLWEERHELA